MVFSLSQLQEKCREQQMPMYLAFIFKDVWSCQLRRSLPHSSKDRLPIKIAEHDWLLPHKHERDNANSRTCTHTHTHIHTHIHTRARERACALQKTKDKLCKQTHKQLDKLMWTVIHRDKLSYAQNRASNKCWINLISFNKRMHDQIIIV